jgi:hypothetical protein
MDAAAPARLKEPPLALLRRAAGDRRAMASKLVRLARALRSLADAPALSARLERLRALGHVDVAPTRLQLVVGSIDMLRFWITPAAAEYYASLGIDFGFHQVLRVLEEPASMVDPTGLLTERDVIIDHLLQVTHANPAYDLQLLESHQDGLAELMRQVQAAVAGAHPKQAQLEATVEDTGYHARLLAYAQAFADDRGTRPPLRDNIQSARWAPIERTFGTLPAALRYCRRMPARPLDAARHVLTTRAFPERLAEPV